MLDRRQQCTWGENRHGSSDTYTRAHTYTFKHTLSLSLFKNHPLFQREMITFITLISARSLASPLSKTSTVPWHDRSASEAVDRRTAVSFGVGDGWARSFDGCVRIVDVECTWMRLAGFDTWVRACGSVCKGRAFVTGSHKHALHRSNNASNSQQTKLFFSLSEWHFFLSLISKPQF